MGSAMPEEEVTREDIHSAMKNAIEMIEKYKKICEIVTDWRHGGCWREGGCDCDRCDRVAMKKIHGVLNGG